LQNSIGTVTNFIATFARARQVGDRLGDSPEDLHITPWLIVGVAGSGELGRSRETAVTLLAERGSGVTHQRHRT
jgi:hypothetical protein